MGNRLLLADDSITIQKVVAIIFANEEFELTVVDNGNAALEKAREIKPDVMLVDALMPGRTGYEVCAELRRDPKLSAVPILLLIGAFEPLDEGKAKECGADDTISKPFESQQLIDKVKQLMEVGKARKAAPAAAAALAVPAGGLPLEAAAEELWGDLSAFDTMAPVAEPVAPPQTPRQAAPSFAAAAPSQAAWEPAPQPQPAPAQQPQPAQPAPSFAAPKAPAAPEPEILEASLDDDLWGAFELEDVVEPTASPSEVFGVVEPEGEFEAEEFFTFEEEEEIAETGPALDLVEEPVVQPEAEDVFSFAETPAAAAAEPAPFELPEYEPFSFDVEPAETAAPATPVATPAAAAPAHLAFEAPRQEPQAAPSFAAGFAEENKPTPQPAATGLSEADLTAAISRISREVIERIVWEVVPDLAEVLIKEEIKKLRAGARG
jgi:CheY-like chemotaxis protein